MSAYTAEVATQIATLTALIRGDGTDCAPNQEWIDDHAEMRFHPERYEGADQ